MSPIFVCGSLSCVVNDVYTNKIPRCIEIAPNMRKRAFGNAPRSRKRVAICKTRRGNESMQSVAIMAIGVLLLLGFQVLWYGRLPKLPNATQVPELPTLSPQSQTGLLVFGGLLGALAWCGKLFFNTISRNTEMFILEVLSDGVPRKRQELLKECRRI